MLEKEPKDGSLSIKDGWSSLLAPEVVQLGSSSQQTWQKLSQSWAGDIRCVCGFRFPNGLKPARRGAGASEKGSVA